MLHDSWLHQFRSHSRKVDLDRFTNVPCQFRLEHIVWWWPHFEVRKMVCKLQRCCLRENPVSTNDMKRCAASGIRSYHSASEERFMATSKDIYKDCSRTSFFWIADCQHQEFLAAENCRRPQQTCDKFPGLGVDGDIVFYTATLESGQTTTIHSHTLQ